MSILDDDGYRAFLASEAASWTGTAPFHCLMRASLDPDFLAFSVDRLPLDGGPFEPQGAFRWPIDDVVLALKRRTRGPRLRSDTDHREVGLIFARRGPYAFSRMSLVQAVQTASRADPSPNWNKARAIEAAVNHLVRAHASLSAFQSEPGKQWITGETGIPYFDAPDAWALAQKLLDVVLSATAAIETLVGLGRRDVARIGRGVGRPPETWKEVFVACMAYHWRALTTTFPNATKATGMFPDFVNAGWDSLPGDPPACNWERAIAAGVEHAKETCVTIDRFTKNNAKEVEAYWNAFWDFDTNTFTQFPLKNEIRAKTDFYTVLNDRLRD